MIDKLSREARLLLFYLRSCQFDQQTDGATDWDWNLIDDETGLTTDEAAKALAELAVAGAVAQIKVVYPQEQ